MPARRSRLRRAHSRNPSNHKPRVLRAEWLEPREVLNGGSLWGHVVALGPYSAAGHVTAPTANAAPTVAKPITIGGNGTVAGKSAALTVLGADDKGESNLVYIWTTTSAPSGGSAKFSASGTNAAKNTTITFTKVGVYGICVTIVDSGGLSVTSRLQVSDGQTLTSINVSTADTRALLVPGTPYKLTSVNQQLAAVALDQFGNAMTFQPTFIWTSSFAPAGAAPSITASGATAKVAFSTAGAYGVMVSANGSGNVSASTTVTLAVNQAFTSILVSPNTASLHCGATQQFTAQALDQFQHAMAVQPSFTWWASGGAISSSGLYTAPSTAGNVTVAAGSGSLWGTVAVAVSAAAPSPGGLQDPTLASLVQSLDADGSLSRNDMLKILQSVAANGPLGATDFSDLKTIVANATKYNMPGYVQVLAADVVNGNPANASFQGQALGNLKVGSSATQFGELIGKWFLGTDHPALTSNSYTYCQAGGTLFPSTPSHHDEYQGQLGDCYFISSLGTIADRNPAAIQNMFIDNGDGTFTVRFYGGQYGSFTNPDGTVSDGFTNNQGTADYVTVDRMLATSGGTLIYADYGCSASSATNSLWIPLAEKAYAQWNQTGKEGRDGANAFASIEGGWMATVDAQVLGHNATDYGLTNSTKLAIVTALGAGEAVTMGTTNSGGDGLYGCHAYAVLSYNLNSDTFTLYNPWGSNQPGQLTWSQLEATCDAYVVANPSGSTPIGGGTLHAPLAVGVDAVLGNDDLRHLLAVAGR